jgi:hypothetical protein
MNDKGKVIAGLIIFVVVFTFPIWYNHLKATEPPEPELTEKAKQAEKCVTDTEYIRTEHMELLDVWRDTVVRDGERIYVNEEGEEFVASLTDTCMDCHSNKEEFCDKCHDYASVEPYCWDCHTYPEEKK